MTNSKKPLKITNFKSGNRDFTFGTLDIIVEQQVDLFIDNEKLLTFNCSPPDLDALAIGFLWNEGIINDLSELQNISIKSDNSRIDVSLQNPVGKPQSLLRNSTGISILGQNEIEQINNPFTIKAESIIHLYNEFSSKQFLHKSAGGFHSAGLSDGEIVNLTVEDLGRHNCLDKISGRFIINGRSFSPKLILLSGRVSSEMIHKVLKLNTPIIVSRTTPTTKAVEIAKTKNITIIGYLRDDHFSIFTNPARILK